MTTLNNQEVPERYRQLFERAAKGSSPVSAIRAACLACVGFISKEVTLCTAPHCPLYPYRLGADQRYRNRKRDADNRESVPEPTLSPVESFRVPEA